MRTLWWLRRVHGWIGLWSAVLGLLFGVTGVLLNHRAVMKLPAAQTNERNLQLKLPVPALSRVMRSARPAPISTLSRSTIAAGVSRGTAIPPIALAS